MKGRPAGPYFLRTGEKCQGIAFIKTEERPFQSVAASDSGYQRRRKRSRRGERTAQG